MECLRCGEQNPQDEHRCTRCGAGLAVALLEVVRGNLAERLHFLKPRSYTIGRARHNDLCLIEASISKAHAHLEWRDGAFHLEDAGSLHGVYVDATKVEHAQLAPGSLVQLGNVTLKYTTLPSDTGTTASSAEFPWIEQQQLLLSLVQTLNATLVLEDVLEQVLDAVMRITRAERGFLLLEDHGPSAAEPWPEVAGLSVRVSRSRNGGTPPEPRGLSTSVVRRASRTGETVATGNAATDPSLASSDSVALMELRTIVCIPLLSPRSELRGDDERPQALGVIYVDNQETSAPFGADGLRTAEALARHAALAIENAQLFEREQKTIEELRMAQRQVLHAEKLATIGQMAAGITHELNTPLTYIMGNLELLQAQPLSEDQRGMLESINRGAERIRVLAQNLLAVSRPSTERPASLAINVLIERCLELCRYQIVKGGIQLERHLADDLPEVRAVASEVEIALINLIVNAVQAAGAGGHVTVSSRAGDAAVEILVADDGPGVPPEARDHVFEPFYTTKPEGEGSGLGLSTVLMAIERQAGSVDFTSEASGGTTFRVRLPLAGKRDAGFRGPAPRR